jgi:hypothetical protein
MNLRRLMVIVLAIGCGEASAPNDAGVDAGFPDAGSSDAGIQDAGAPDSGTPDAGEIDAGFDAGEIDAGFDAGEIDAGSDAGFDAGVDIDDCAAAPCQHGALCIDGTFHFDCVCTAGWTGRTCELDVDECARRPPCSSAQRCFNDAGTFSCACADGGSTALCAPATTLRPIELLIVYDRALVLRDRDRTEAKLLAAINQAKTIFDSTQVGTVRFTLGVGAMIDGTKNLPPAVTDVADGGAGPRLDGFTTWVNANRAALTTMVGHPFDHAMLITGLPFAAPFRELAFVGSTCTNNSTSAISFSNDLSIDGLGVLIAHAIGHSLSATHDATGTYVMSPYGVPAPMSLPAFSPASITAFQNYLATLGTNSCLSDLPPANATSPHCGDGVVQGSEQCDPGVGLTDACCTSSCALASGCACANTDSCCAGGNLRDGGIGRASRNPCDLAEICDGTSAEPIDTYASAGIACPMDAGTCFRGACTPTLEASCQAVDPTVHACAAASFACDRLWCTQPASACTMPGSTWYSVSTPDGTPCATGSVCSSAVCTSVALLHDYAWSTGAFSACLQAVQSRPVSCRDETGALAPDSLCPSGTRPQSARSCP